MDDGFVSLILDRSNPSGFSIILLSWYLPEWVNAPKFSEASRRLIKESETLILEEMTSAPDSQRDSLVQAALEELKRDRTVIANAHQVVVWEAGNILGNNIIILGNNIIAVHVIEIRTGVTIFVGCKS